MVYFCNVEMFVLTCKKLLPTFLVIQQPRVLVIYIVCCKLISKLGVKIQRLNLEAKFQKQLSYL